MDWSETSATAARASAEVPVSFAGPAGVLCGIFTPAAPDTRADRRCVILPARPRFAFRRLPVLTARFLAASGIAVLRFDLRGAGESGGPSEADSRHHTHGEDVAAAIAHLRQTIGLERFILIGYCFDALCALEASCVEAGAIDGLLCIAAPVTAEAIAISPLRKLTRGARSPGRLLSRLKDPRSAARLLRSGGQLIAAIGEREAAPRIAPKFEQGFRALEKSRVRALFLYGEEDALRQEFALAERELFATLSDEARARLQVEIWPGAVHSIEMEPAIFERAITWVSELGPALNT
jgi:pimeloyl-ACP methyl ester carboxylesterase